MENYNEIKAFLKGSTCGESARLCPISANYNANIDKLVEAIETTIPTPKKGPCASGKDVCGALVRHQQARGRNREAEGRRAGRLAHTGNAQGGRRDRDASRSHQEGEGQGEGVHRAHCPEGRARSWQAASLCRRRGPAGLSGIATGLDPAVAKSDHLRQHDGQEGHASASSVGR